jgi:hypothetical protein
MSEDVVRAKRCTKCREVKPLAEFFANGGSERWRPDCKTCQAVTRRAEHLRRVYGITPDEYDLMADAQGGVCAICKRPPSQMGIKVKGEWRRRAPREGLDKLVVDHDHETGKVRALLCQKCNAGIGNFGEDVSLMAAAIEYLERHAAS